MNIDLSNAVKFPNSLTQSDSTNKQEVDDIFKNFDADGSGTLNLKEALKSGAEDEKIFRRADADGNGAVSKDELIELFNKLEKEDKSSGISLQQLVNSIRNADSSLIDQLLAADKKSDQESFDTLLSKLLSNNRPDNADSGSLINTSI